MQRSGTPLGLGLQGAFQSEAAGGGVRGGGPAMRINKKVRGAWVVATPDGVWHKDSHCRSQLIGGGVHKIQMLIRENTEDFLQNFTSKKTNNSKERISQHLEHHYSFWQIFDQNFDQCFRLVVGIFQGALFEVFLV